MSLKNNLNRKKVVLGLSGGVDSTAAALLLKSKGFEVIGLYFNVHKKNTLSDRHGIEKAKKIAKELEIKIHIVDVNKNFEDCIIGNFLEEYSKGRTPNPCIICNPLIKFKTLVNIANDENAFYVATGHYAKTGYSDTQKCHVISMGDNIKKDQSYMLYRLPESYVERLILPLGEADDKEKIRNFVRENDLSNADDKDSQEICFIPDDMPYQKFLKNNGISASCGDFVDKHGNLIGTHQGIINYTVGQRKGLGIAIGKPAFVTKIISDENKVVIGDNKDLFVKNIKITNCYFQSTDSKKFPEKLLKYNLKCKIRYKAALSDCCVIETSEDGITLEFSESQRAPAPGQSAVIYFNNEVVGGGFIE